MRCAVGRVDAVLRPRVRLFRVVVRTLEQQRVKSLTHELSAANLLSGGAPQALEVEQVRERRREGRSGRLHQSSVKPEGGAVNTRDDGDEGGAWKLVGVASPDVTERGRCGEWLAAERDAIGGHQQDVGETEMVVLQLERGLKSGGLTGGYGGLIGSYGGLIGNAEQREEQLKPRLCT